MKNHAIAQSSLRSLGVEALHARLEELRGLASMFAADAGQVPPELDAEFGAIEAELGARKDDERTKTATPR